MAMGESTLRRGDQRMVSQQFKFLTADRECRAVWEKIFEQFYRAQNSLNSGIQGAGLGLTLARQIARANGGDVVYEPHPGGGSQFSIKLNTAQAE